MDKITINKNNYNTKKEILNIVSAYTDNVYLYMFAKGFCHTMIGDYIQFDRKVYSEDINDNKPIVSNRKVVCLTRYFKDDDVTCIITVAEPRTLVRLQEVGIEENYYTYTFEDNTNIFAQDIVFAREKGLNPTIDIFYTDDSSFMPVIEDICFNELNIITGKRNYEFLVSGCQSAERFIYNHYNEVDHNDCDKESTPKEPIPMYYYFPYKRKNNVLASINYNSPNIIGNNLFYKYNALYCQSDEATTLPFDLFPKQEVYECYFWEDVEDVPDGVKREVLNDDGTQKYNNIEITKVSDFWGVSVGLSSDIDYSHLYQEQNIIDLYTKSVKKKVIDAATVIDMEKMKFSPHYEDGGIYLPITSITYNLHFRQRDLEEEGWNYIEGDDIFWNPEYSEGESGLTPDNLQGSEYSDMLYYLGFDDNDVQYQKMKLKKSFLRLSFYSSPDILTQKLLYYSTIFFDTGELLGKFIKAKNELLKEGQDGDNVVLNSEYLDKYRLDCRFVVKNEFFTAKSSDGFNIYYFPDDVIEEENSEKTIYMKVEFNHAKYGRTIPMIMWPESGLTMDSLPEALYIPLKLKYIGNKQENVSKERAFIYVLEENEYIKRDNNVLELNLVEPKLID